MDKIGVVIPYHQRTGGLLRRALQSIYAQELEEPAQVRVIVADNESPAPPEPEVIGLARPGFSVEIVKRPNGGPSAGRNTGLKAVGEVDYVAFLDSDDWWEPRHLAVAVGALRNGCGFYFADVRDEDSTWFASLKCKDALTDAATPCGETLWISRAALMPLFLDEYIAHTSSVVFSTRSIGPLLFDETQATAGEDYLYWLTATSRSKTIAFSTKPMAARGRGVDLYRGAGGWDSPECTRRLFYNLMLHKKMLARFCQTEEERNKLRARVRRGRMEILFLFVRNARARAHAKTNSWVAARLFKADPAFWLTLPSNALTILYQRLFSTLEFARE